MKKAELRIINLNTELGYEARKSNDFNSFCSIWDVEYKKIEKLANDVFYKFQSNCKEVLDAMNKIDKKLFYEYSIK